ncbi:MAG: AzlC family ABC transporter permease [Lachnospiraceae bacterium]
MNEWKKGLVDGIPIGLGYLSVSFTFGIMAVADGLNWWQALLISMTNLTSAGQFAGLEIMVSMGAFLEMALTELVINMRYFLMSVSLSQKVDRHFKGIFRWFLATGNTDEIFAVAMSRKKPVSWRYFAGLMTVPYLGWSGGTLIGAICGNVLPKQLCDSLGIAIYGMFLAIIIPSARKDKRIGVVVGIAVLLSCILAWVPCLKQISSGFAIIICALVASAIGAWFFPMEVEEE